MVAGRGPTPEEQALIDRYKSQAGSRDINPFELAGDALTSSSQSLGFLDGISHTVGLPPLGQVFGSASDASYGLADATGSRGKTLYATDLPASYFEQQAAGPTREQELERYNSRAPLPKEISSMQGAQQFSKQQGPPKWQLDAQKAAAGQVNNSAEAVAARGRDQVVTAAMNGVNLGRNPKLQKEIAGLDSRTFNNQYNQGLDDNKVNMADDYKLGPESRPMEDSSEYQPSRFTSSGPRAIQGRAMGSRAPRPSVGKTIKPKKKHTAKKLIKNKK